jgi:hypothetical protein
MRDVPQNKTATPSPKLCLDDPAPTTELSLQSHVLDDLGDSLLDFVLEPFDGYRLHRPIYSSSCSDSSQGPS